MISLAGLSAEPGGYQAAEDARAKTEKTQAETQANQTKQRDAAIKLLGANVAGAALAGQPGGGPQAPPPGQPSVPARPPMPPPAPPMPQGGPPPGAPSPAPPPQAAAPPVAPATSKLPLDAAIQRILQSTPGVAQHPEILLSALTHLNDLGLLDPEAQAKVADISKQHTLNRIESAKGHLKAVQDGAPAAPEAPAASAAAKPPPTATDPKTGAKVQWDGKAWQPIPQ